MDPPQDTETLLAILASLLPASISTSQDLLLDVLLEADGDVHAAARILTAKESTEGTIRPPSSKGKKRKREGGLDGWLSREEKPRSVEKPRSISKRSSTLEEMSPLFVPGTSRSSKEAVPLLSVLRPPPSSSKASARLPPTTLSTTSLITKHTPITFHPAVLPPELACRLYYDMLDEAKGWNKNKWWLVDRLVESPHRTAFYVRELPKENDLDWREASRSWYFLSSLTLHPLS